MTQTEKFEFKTLSPVWITCPYPAVALGLEKMLEAKTWVYDGQSPPMDEAPSSIIICPRGEDVDLEIRRLQTLVPDVPILVLGLRVDTQLARTALLAGAHGFVYLEMQPVQIINALSAVLKDQTVVPVELLEAFLAEMASQADLDILTPDQREFLELVATSETSGGEILIPRELLEAFLRDMLVA